MSETDVKERLREIYDTRAQQRCLLRHLFTSPYAAQKFYLKTRDEFFDSAERRWLVRTGRTAFQETGSLLNENVLKGELDRYFKFLDEEESQKKRRAVLHATLTHDSIMTEWNLVEGASQSETPEWLLTDLERKKRASEAVSIMQGAIDKMSFGESDEAINELCSKIISVRGQSNKIKPVRKFTDMDWRVELIKNKKEHPELFAGMKTGFETFDRKTGGLFRGELFLECGHTGGHKSTVIRSLIQGMLYSGQNILLVVNEEVEEQVSNKFDAMITGITYQEFKRASLNEKDVEKWKVDISQFASKAGELYIQEIPQFTTVAEIEATLVDLKQKGVRIDAIFLDYLDHLKPVQRAWSETDEQNKAISEFKDLIMRYRVGGFTATQADTASFDKEERSSYNVRGSKQKSGAANLVMFIKQISTFDDSGSVDLKVIVTKNRDGPSFLFYLRFHCTTGLVKEIPDPGVGKSSSSSSPAKEGDGNKDSAPSKKPVLRPQRQAVVIAPEVMHGLEEPSLPDGH